MKKLVIFSCLKSNVNCTAMSCVKGFKNRSGQYARYVDEDIELMTVTHCSHCVEEMDPAEDEGFLKKAEKLASEGIDIVHIASCAAKKDCPGIRKMAEIFRDKGMEVVLGGL